MNDKPKHTLGPWKAGKREGHPWHVDTLDGRVAVFGTALKGTKKQQEANALLIAAAPDLLHAVKILASFIENGPTPELDFFAVREIWRNAIHKATKGA